MCASKQHPHFPPQNHMTKMSNDPRVVPQVDPASSFVCREICRDRLPINSLETRLEHVPVREQFLRTVLYIYEP